MFITKNNSKIYATSFGSERNPAILGIGGWIGSWELWAEPFSILSRDWHTLAYDHRGAGATLAPVESITYEALVEDVFTVLDAYGVERCVLAAESAGALTALGAALQSPDRITGLVIVDGVSHMEISPDDPFLLGLHHDYENTIANFILACEPIEGRDHIRRWGKQIVGRASQESAIALYRSASQVDLRADLHGIFQPALIFHGEQDALVPLDSARWLASSLPNAKLVVLKEAGHVPTLTHAEEIASRLSDFFQNDV